MPNAIVGSVTIIMVFGLPIGIFYLFYLGKRRKLETLVKLVELGGEIKPEMLQLLEKPSGRKSELRSGLIWLAIGIPLTLSIFFSEGFAEAMVGTIPIFIGIAYLLVMKYGHDDSSTDNSIDKTL